MITTEKFTIVFPVYGKMDEIKIGKYGLKIFNITSELFSAVLNDKGLDKGLKNKLDYIFAYELEKYCFVIHTTNNDKNMWSFFHFLCFIKPSNITPLASIEVRYHRLRGRKTIFQIGGSSTWPDANIDLAMKHCLCLPGEFNLFHKQLDKFINLPNDSSFHKVLNIYFEAVLNKKPYLKFLVLNMLIETLIGTDKEAGISYKIRRTCAVLLGSDEEKCSQIYANINDVYAARSTLVHSASTSKMSNAMIVYLNYVVCEVLNTLLLTGIKYDEVFSITNKYGYGQRTLILQNHKVKRDLRYTDNTFILDQKIRVEEKPKQIPKKKAKQQKKG